MVNRSILVGRRSRPGVPRRRGRESRRCFLSEDRQSVGFIVCADGEVANVFNLGRPGRGGEAVNTAIAHGGRKLNCFDTGLVEYYHGFGFREVGRVPFDRALAPAEWNYARYGAPDVVFMELL